jgi:HemY protein
MRGAFSLLLVLAVAVALALLAGNNQSTVTLFWPPHRVDLSFNFALLAFVGAFWVLHLALRALAALFALPTQAKRWRQMQRERAMFGALLESLSHQTAGRFLRARRAAELALDQESRLHASGERHARGPSLRAMAHLLAAESSHALQDREGRASHWEQAAAEASATSAQEEREAVQLRAVRWALDDRDGHTALLRLADLPAGVARRTVALRLKLKAARQAGQLPEALATARLLTKHRAFSSLAGQSLVQGLVLESIAACAEAPPLLALWNGLDASEQARPDIAVAAAQQWLALGGPAEQAAQWLLPCAQAAWDDARAQAHSSGATANTATVRLVGVMAQALLRLEPAQVPQWLVRIEHVLQEQPGNPLLLYLAAHAGYAAQLWGKAGLWASRSLPLLRGTSLEAGAWRLQALLAEQRGEPTVAASAWKSAATVTRPDS